MIRTTSMSVSVVVCRMVLVMKRSAVLLVAAVALLAGCQSAPTTPAPSGGVLPAPVRSSTLVPQPSPTRSDPTLGLPRGGATNLAGVAASGTADEVGVAYVKALHTTDSTKDRSLFEPRRRAAVLASGALRNRLMNDPPGVPPTWWVTMSAHKGYTSVQVKALPVPDAKDTPTQVFRLYQVLVSATDGKGWTSAQPLSAMYVVLSKVDGTWKVAFSQEALDGD